MTIWETGEEADYTAERYRRLQDQWRTHCNSLVQGIALSKARLHYAVSCAPDRDLCFVLSKYFTIYVTLVGGFNSHTIEYYVETKNGDDRQLIAQAELTINGKINERTSNCDHEQVLKHYLEKIATVYNSLCITAENNILVNLSQLVEGHSSA